jgi:hypothetical protein
MKLNDLSHDWRVLFGLGLVMLGGVNWTVGRLRTEQYGHILATQPGTLADEAYRSFDEVDSPDAVLEPFSSRQRKFSYATARMDFYHVTVMTGDAFIGAGLLLTCLGFLRLIRRDAKRVIERRLGARPNGEWT